MIIQINHCQIQAKYLKFIFYVVEESYGRIYNFFSYFSLRPINNYIRFK